MKLLPKNRSKSERTRKGNAANPAGIFSCGIFSWDSVFDRVNDLCVAAMCSPPCLRTLSRLDLPPCLSVPPRIRLRSGLCSLPCMRSPPHMCSPPCMRSPPCVCSLPRMRSPPCMCSLLCIRASSRFSAAAHLYGIFMWRDGCEKIFQGLT